MSESAANGTQTRNVGEAAVDRPEDRAQRPTSDTGGGLSRRSMLKAGALAAGNIRRHARGGAAIGSRDRHRFSGGQAVSSVRAPRHVVVDRRLASA